LARQEAGIVSGGLSSSAATELQNLQRQEDKARERDKRFGDGGGMVNVQSVPGPSSLEAVEVVDDPLLDFL